MDEIRLGAIESRFADMIWQYEPISSGELAKMCAKELYWKKSTTYTVLKKLCERGIFQNQDGFVTSLISRSDFFARQGEQLVQEAFDGSLPAFIAAFTRRQSLSSDEVSQIRQMIDAYEES